MQPPNCAQGQQDKSNNDQDDDVNMMIMIMVMIMIMLIMITALSTFILPGQSGSPREQGAEREQVREVSKS